MTKSPGAIFNERSEPGGESQDETSTAGVVAVQPLALQHRSGCLTFYKRFRPFFTFIQIKQVDNYVYPDKMNFMRIKDRLLHLSLLSEKSAFLWGSRKVGKSYWIKQNYPNAILIDFLKSDVLGEYMARPALLRERYQDTQQRIVLDEVQKVPSILDEVHWLIENKNIGFLLTGSSPRKLRRSHANMLGGRAWRYTMTPLCFPEIENFDIHRVMQTGLLPPHILSTDPIQDWRAYVGDYLKEEIIAEVAVQNIPAFSEFLRIAAITSGELINYANVGRETGVKTHVVRSYFQILEDTLLGFRLSPWRRAVNRRLIETEKFYLFDVGLTNYLARRIPQHGTPEFGKAFEQFILLEFMAYKAYRNPELPLYYWRTSSGAEVDFILGEMEVAIEIKTAARVHEMDTRSLQLLQSEHTIKKSILVSFESEPKKLGNVECIPWKLFLEKLWAGEII